MKIKILNYTIFIFFIALLSWLFWTNANDLPDLPWQARALWLGLGAALGVYMLAVLILAINWRMLLAGMGEGVPRGLGEAIFLATQIGKYLPGNVGHFVGRAALAKAHGVGLLRGGGSIVIEQGLTLAVGILVLGVGLALSPPGLEQLEAHLPAPRLWAALLMASALGPLLLAPALGYLAPRLPGAVGRFAVELAQLRTRHVLRFVLLQSGIFLLGGAALMPLAIIAGGMVDFVTAVTIFTAAWVLGYITPGAPGGLGVRESVLTLALTPSLGGGAALTVALLLRLVTVASDGLAFLLGVAGLRYYRAKKPDMRDVQQS